MNQSIQFPDREEWLAEEKKIQFPVMINGMLLDCQVTEDELFKRFGNKENALIVFQKNRWEIEEEFEELIINNELSALHPVYSLLMDV
ncbi:MAG TPA: DUF1488 domain-containing protein [Proteus sp.]|nr:DUF1488 domain-containing protein [Proteus sp. (in: enterobacteria)]